MSSTHSQRIISDPVSWIHPSRTGLPDLCYEGIPRGIINKTLVRQFSLDDDNSLITGGSIAQAVIDNWYLLREAAWNMACQRYRIWILQDQSPGLLTPKARSFMMLNIIAAESYRSEKVDESKMWQLAYAELLPLHSFLTEAFVKRLRLLFPTEVKEVFVENKSEFDFVFFLMAIQHEKKFTVAI